MNKDLLRHLQCLDAHELRRVIIYAQSLLLEEDGSIFESVPFAGSSSQVPQAEAPSDPEKPAVTYRQQYVQCGKKTCTRCPHGPYWYGYWREDGRSRSRYLGKKLPEHV